MRRGGGRGGGDESFFSMRSVLFGYSLPSLLLTFQRQILLSPSFLGHHFYYAKATPKSSSSHQKLLVEEEHFIISPFFFFSGFTYLCSLRL